MGVVVTIQRAGSQGCGTTERTGRVALFTLVCCPNRVAMRSASCSLVLVRWCTSALVCCSYL